MSQALVRCHGGNESITPGFHSSFFPKLRGKTRNRKPGIKASDVHVPCEGPYLRVIRREPQHVVLDETNEQLVVKLDDVSPGAHRDVCTVENVVDWCLLPLQGSRACPLRGLPKDGVAGGVRLRSLVGPTVQQHTAIHLHTVPTHSSILHLMATLWSSSHMALGLWLVAVLAHDLLKGHIQPQDLHRQ